MSLKAIELQIALPRTFDAGKIQEQQDQKHQHMYTLAAQELTKEEDRKRTTVIKGEENAKIDFSKHQDKEGLHLAKKAKSEEAVSQDSVKIMHPYKGNSIDYSG